MSIVAATLEPQSRPVVTTPVIARSELARLEGLGDNCELGFLLRRIGFEDGMLFRWVAIRPQFLLATLRGEFENIYQFDNLVPQQVGMTRDLHYGSAWHTQMSSSMREGTLVFDDDKQTRRPIHAREAAKIAYLIEKLRRKFLHPNPVFVIKANIGIPERLLEEIHYQLYRRVASPRFLLLEVCADASRAGAVELLDRNRMRGYLTHLAPYDRLGDADDAGWISVLRQALAHNADDASTVSRPTLPVPASAELVLPFPSAARTDLLEPLPGDLRGGMPSLIGGNTWCRMVDDDTYRLHATGLNAAATALTWTGVHLPPDCTVTVAAGCAIAESEPVHATLKIVAADGTTLRKQHIFARVVGEDFSLSATVKLPNPLTVSLLVEPLRPLRDGERAVIDMGPIRVAPAKPARPQ